MRGATSLRASIAPCFLPSSLRNPGWPNARRSAALPYDASCVNRTPAPIGGGAKAANERSANPGEQHDPNAPRLRAPAICRPTELASARPLPRLSTPRCRRAARRAKSSSERWRRAARRAPAVALGLDAPRERFPVPGRGRLWQVRPCPGRPACGTPRCAWTLEPCAVRSPFRRMHAEFWCHARGLEGNDYLIDARSARR